MCHFVRYLQPQRTGGWSAEIGKEEGERGVKRGGEGEEEGWATREGEESLSLPRRDERTNGRDSSIRRTDSRVDIILFYL